MTRYVYLHGFASSPQSGKAQFFCKRLAEQGIDLAIPALDGGDFEHLTVTGQLHVVDAAVAGEPAVLFGSSLGGYLAALYAARHANIRKLILLAPAFQFPSAGGTVIPPKSWRLGDETAPRPSSTMDSTARCPSATNLWKIL